MVVSSWQIIFSTTLVDNNGVPQHSRRRSFVRSTQVGTLRDHRDSFDRSVGGVNAIDKADAKLVHG